MLVLTATTPSWARNLEIALITRFKYSRAEPGCQNEAPGGESLPPVPPVFVYCVYASIDDMQQHRLAEIGRRSASRC